MKKYSSETFWQDLKSGKFASMVKESSKGQQVMNAKEVYNVMKPFVAEHDDVEAFYGLFLDTQNRIIEIQKLFSGTLTIAPVYPREIAKLILANKSSAIIFVHNHPSGDPKPSGDDRNITAKLGIMLESLQVSLHDHVIVGDGYFSFAEDGFIKETKRRIDKFITSV